MTESAAKRPRLSVEDVLVEMEDEETEHMTVGSDDEFVVRREKEMNMAV